MAEPLNVLVEVGNNMALEDYMDVIQEAARTGMIVNIDYQSHRDGKFSMARPVELYEIKDGFLWAFDINAGSIKKFYTDGITNIILTDMPYYPRWEVKIY